MRSMELSDSDKCQEHKKSQTFHPAHWASDILFIVGVQHFRKMPQVVDWLAIELQHTNCLKFVTKVYLRCKNLE